MEKIEKGDIVEVVGYARAPNGEMIRIFKIERELESEQMEASNDEWSKIELLEYREKEEGRWKK